MWVWKKLSNMENINLDDCLTEFEFEGQKQRVSFVETMNVTDRVTCDVYKIDNDETKDLGIIKVQSGFKTPLQKVLKGDRTVEGYISGIGKLVVSKKDGEDKTYEVKEGDSLSVNVEIGEKMQWQAGDEPLVAYEVCFPPFEEGRYENIPEEVVKASK